MFGGLGRVIGVAAEKGGPTLIREFHCERGVVCLPKNAAVSLTKSPGGDLSTLLVVLSNETGHKEHHSRSNRSLGCQAASKKGPDIGVQKGSLTK